jgi:GTP-binding protein
VPRGGPDGGDGGRGGSVVVKATNQVSDLALYKRRTRWQAEPGADGAGGRKTGRNGADVVLEVPVGTLVLDQDGALVADLDHPDASSVVVRGGIGGRGNVHFKSSSRRAPDYSEPGRKGEELAATLDLKLIADVGLVGPPNAGKSSLLAALTAAHPKVADYPFTTLDPELGVADSPAGRIVIAEIPGLVAGASHGAGLGHRFLRHIERTRVLVYIVDGSAANPWKDLETVKSEVEHFSQDLAQRPYVVVANKLDLEKTKELRKRSRRKGIHFVSALTHEGLAELIDAIVPVLAIGSSTWSSTPTSIRKARSSASSHSSTGWESTRPSRRRGSRLGTRSASAASSSSTNREGGRRAPRGAWWDVRSHPHRTPRGGEGRDRMRAPRPCDLHAHRAATASASSRRASGTSARDDQARRVRR